MWANASRVIPLQPSSRHSAARATLVLSVVNKLLKVDDGIQLRSSLTASGTAMSESGPVAAQCTSLGALEKRLESDPSKLQCATRTTFATTVVTAERMPTSAGPITPRGRGPVVLPRDDIGVRSPFPG